MQKAKSYAPGLTKARTPEPMQSDKEKNWYRFHETPYPGHKLSFGPNGPAPVPPPQFRFDSSAKSVKRKLSTSSKGPEKSAMKKRTRTRLGEGTKRRSNAEEFHANFSKSERNELYARYTKFLISIRFDVKHFTTSLQSLCLPTDIICKVHEKMKRPDWDIFMKIMADEE